MKSVEETMAAWVNITDKTNKEQVVILRLRKVPCVQEVATPFYIVSYYIKWGNYFLDTRYPVMLTSSWPIVIGRYHMYGTIRTADLSR